MIALTIFIVLALLVLTNRIGGGTYVAVVLYAFDVFCCTLVMRENCLSLSGQTAIYWREGHPPLFWKWLHEGLNTLQHNHCELALEHDRARALDVIKRTQ
jgi:hypothetical protein